MTKPLTEKIRKGLGVLENVDPGMLLTNINSCVHCGLCAESCIYYKATGEDKFSPSRKADLVASIVRKYFTFTGKHMPFLINARELDEENIKRMIDLLFGACTMCGRCTMHCSVGVDIAFLVRTGRSMLSAMGMVPASLQSTVTAAIETGNNMGIPVGEFIDTIQWMEDELKDELNCPDVRIPLDEPGKDVLYTLNPREPKFFPLSISAMAKIFHAASESWTLSTSMYDITNYAYFSGNPDEARSIAQRMWNEMDHLGSTTLVLAECGHGSRALRWESPNYFQRSFPFRVRTSVEIIADYVLKGRIRLDKQKIKETVTLHDPCNLVRTGGIFREQRDILNHFIGDFREMNPNGTDNYCCGGGGGQLAMSEYSERRMKAGMIKAEQIRSTGAKIVVSPCHNCVDQLSQLNVSCKLNVQVKTLAEIVADALIL